MTDAVEAHDSSLSVTSVRKDPDGSYDVLVTNADGSEAMLQVSAALDTFTENAGPGADHGRRGGDGTEDDGQTPPSTSS